MQRQTRFSFDRVFVMACGLTIAVGVVAVVGMLFTAFAFTNGSTITVPLVATFDGIREINTSPTVTVTGSWLGAGVTTLVIALPIWIVTLRPRDAPVQADS